MELPRADLLAALGIFVALIGVVAALLAVAPERWKLERSYKVTIYALLVGVMCSAIVLIGLMTRKDPTPEIANKAEEEKEFQEFIHAKYKQECYLSYPESWTRFSDSRGQITVFPGPNSYFSKYDFRFSFSEGSVSKVMAVFAAADYHDWTEELVKLSWNPAEINRIEKLRKDNPGAYAQIDIEEQLNDVPGIQNQKEAWSAIGNISVRSRIHNEDGHGIEDMSLRVLMRSNKISAGGTIFPAPETDPSFSPASFNTECSANSDMKLPIFNGMCKVLIERITLHSTFPDDACIPGEGDKLRFQK